MRRDLIDDSRRARRRGSRSDAPTTSVSIDEVSLSDRLRPARCVHPRSRSAREEATASGCTCTGRSYKLHGSEARALADGRGIPRGPGKSISRDTISPDLK